MIELALTLALASFPLDAVAVEGPLDAQRRQPQAEEVLSPEAQLQPIERAPSFCLDVHCARA